MIALNVSHYPVIPLALVQPGRHVRPIAVRRGKLSHGVRFYAGDCFRVPNGHIRHQVRSYELHVRADCARNRILLGIVRADGDVLEHQLLVLKGWSRLGKFARIAEQVVNALWLQSQPV